MKTQENLVNDGGPAFPSVDFQSLKGMSLRDYLAGQALVGILSNPSLLNTVDLHLQGSTRQAAAVYAYAVSDAMIAAKGGEK